MDPLAKSAVLPQTLESSSDSVFFRKPDELTIDEDSRTRYASSQKVETLIEELQEKGPLVALGRMGPAAYKELPFQLKDQMCGQDIYGWKPGTRSDHAPQNYAMVLGARKFEGCEYVYFTMSVDVTPNTSSYSRQHRPSPTVAKIYIISHMTFRNFLFDLYPPPLSNSSSASSASSQSQTLEQQYVQKLASMDLDSIIDLGKGEEACKALGQKIFDDFKARAGGNSDAGREMVVRICKRLMSACTDGNLREQYVERAWDGIGDATWRWMS